MLLGASLLLLSSWSLAKDKREISILPFDALAEKDTPVELSCKVEKRNIIGSDLRRAKVAISVGSTLVGEVLTDNQGIARVNYIPRKLGEFTVLFECQEEADHDSGSASSMLFCRDKSKPIIVVDIDQTISDIALEKFLITKTQDIMPLPQAEKVLTDLSKTYDLIFVTARDKHLLKRTKEWLTLREFPKAPVFFRELGKDPLSERKYKTQKIARLKEQWGNIACGVGDRCSDAQAYLANGLRAIIIVPKDDIPLGAHAVQHWYQIKELLTKVVVKSQSH